MPQIYKVLPGKKPIAPPQSEAGTGSIPASGSVLPWGEGNEVRLNDDCSVDEIVVENAFVHIEQMNNGHWWMGITRPDGNRLMVHLTTRKNQNIRLVVESDNGDLSAGFPKD